MNTAKNVSHGGATPLLILAAATFLFSGLFSGSALAGFKERVFETRLSNGLKVLLLEDHKVPLVSVQVWYRTGSRNEQFGKTGISHLLEHMMFKGSKKVSADAFNRMIQENGGQGERIHVRRLHGIFREPGSGTDWGPAGHRIRQAAQSHPA